MKSETTASEKSDTEDEASRPLSRLPATPVTAHLVPLNGLQAPNDDPELTDRGSHAWSPQIHLDLELAIKDAMLGLRWCGYDLELAFKDCRTWPLRSYHDLELATEMRPYLVPSNAATTSNWPSKIAMVGSRTVTTTSSWLQKSGHTWS